MSICHIQSLENSWTLLRFDMNVFQQKNLMYAGFLFFFWFFKFFFGFFPIFISVSQVPDYQEDVKPLKPPPLPPFYQDSVYSGGHHAHPPPPGIEPVTLPTHLQTEPPPPGTDIEDPILPHSQTQVIMDQSQSHSRYC